MNLNISILIKKVYLGLIDHFFPGFLKKYRDLEIVEERKRLVHSLYNGNLIMERFRIEGKQLGAAMSTFEKWMGYRSREEFEEWMLKINDTEQILDVFSKANKWS
jgi:hypothetical protein